MGFWIFLGICFVIYCIYDSSNNSSTKTYRPTYTPKYPKSSNRSSSAKKHKWNFEPKSISTIPENNEILKKLQGFIDEDETIEISYKSSDGFNSTRKIDPLQITEWGGQYYLRAHCNLRNEDRTFKISRIKSINGDESAKVERDIPSSFANHRILIIETDEDLIKSYKSYFRKNKASAKFVSDGITALEVIPKETFDFIYINQKVPYVSGLEILSNIKKRKLSDAPVVIFAENTDEKIKKEAERLDADGYYDFSKNTPEEIITMIEPYFIKE